MLRFYPLFIALALLGCSKAIERPALPKRVNSGDGTANKSANSEKSPKKNPDSGSEKENSETAKNKDSSADKTLPEKPVEPLDPTLKNVIALSEGPLSLGPKAPTCRDLESPKRKSLSVYVNFEVLEPATTIYFSATTLCGELTKKNQLSVYKAPDRALVRAVDLPTQAFSAKTTLLDGLSLEKGRYILAIEVAGTRLNDLSSLLIEGAEITSDKKVKFESITDF